MRRLLASPPQRFARTPALLLLVWITLSGTFPMHLFVPVLPMAARDLGVTPGAIQSAITTYLVGLSAGQLLLGPTSDRFGRRPVLIAGLSLYILGTIGAAAAPTLHALLAARFVQAVGGCAGLVLGRAIARDITEGANAVRKIATLASMTNLGPGLAPVIGAQLAFVLGWRGMFLVLAAVSAILLGLVGLTLPETHIHRRPQPMSAYLRSWRGLLGNPRFLRFAVGGALGSTSFYAFVANAPFILHGRFGYDLRSVGMLYLLVVGSLTAGALIAGRCAGKVRPHRMIVTAASVTLVASMIVLGAEIADATRPWIFLPAIMLLSAAIGSLGPFAMTEAVNADPRAIGAASGLYGCLQMTAGALVVESLQWIEAGPVMATAIVLFTASALSVLIVTLPVGRPRADLPNAITDAERDATIP